MRNHVTRYRGRPYDGDTAVSDYAKPGAVRAALTALGPTLYAVRTRDGLIKIGWTSDLGSRTHTLAEGGLNTLLAWQQADRTDETAIHRALHGNAARGVEYYHPTAEVLAVVNDMRASMGMQPVAPDELVA